MTNYRTYRARITNRLTGESETVDLVREFGLEIPRDVPYEPDTFHAVDWLDARALDEWFARNRGK
jgi:hypothetical protein